MWKEQSCQGSTQEHYGAEMNTKSRKTKKIDVKKVSRLEVDENQHDHGDFCDINSRREETHFDGSKMVAVG
jgi:hypothetical protein